MPNKSESPSDIKNEQKLLRALSALIGRPVTIRPGESINWIKMDGTAAAISIHIVHVEETRREFRITRSGTHLMYWMPCPESHTNPWSCVLNRTDWDEDFEPVIILKQGKVRSRSEWLEQVKWDRMCYRPGTQKSPLDSYSRVLDGTYSESEKRIENYW